MGLLAFVVFGLLVGLVARALMPGMQRMGIVATVVLGIVGSLVGGLLASLVYGGHPLDLHAAGIVGSVLGAMLVMFLIALGPRGRAAV